MENPFSLGAIPSPKDYRDIGVAQAFGEPENLPESYFVDIEKLPIWHQRKNGSCFPAGTKVSMADGSYKNIEDISISEEVLDMDGKARKVVDTMSRKWQGNLVKVSIFGTEDIICTPEHPFLTKRGWISAVNLTKKDYVKIPIRREIKDKTNSFLESNPEFLKLLGLYIAEGSITYPENAPNSCRVTWSLHKKETHLIKFITKTVNRFFSVPVITGFKKDYLGCSVRCSSKFLGDLLVELGGTICDKKQINKRLLTLSPELQIEILRGWLLGDGTFTKKNIEGVTTSYILVRQLYDIALRCGLTPSIRLPKLYANKKQAYVLAFSPVDTEKLFIEKTKHKISKKSDGWRGRNTSEEIFYRRIYGTQILRAKKELTQPWKTVYNLEVEESHSYIVNSVAVHNCIGHAFGKYKQLLDWQDTASVKPLSPRYLYAMAKAQDGYSGEGTYPRGVSKILKDNGCATEDFVPNDSLLPHEEYVYNRDISKIPQGDADKAKISSYAFVDITLDGLKQAIIKGQGVSLLVQVGKEWYTDKGGRTSWKEKDVLPLRPPEEIISGHQIYLYGYDKDRFYFINSWGDTWGKKGIGYFDWKTYRRYITEGITIVDIPEKLLEEVKKLPEKFAFQFTKDMKYGDKNEDVAQLQRFLKLQGVYNYSITGYYGDITKRAVLEFQKRNSITTLWENIAYNGKYCGTKTRAFINKMTIK